MRFYLFDPVLASAGTVGGPGPARYAAEPKGERNCSTCSTWYKRRRRPSRFFLRHGRNFWRRGTSFGALVEGACPELLPLSAARKLPRFWLQLPVPVFPPGSSYRTEFWLACGIFWSLTCALPSRILCSKPVALRTTVWPPAAPESLSTDADTCGYSPGRTLENPTAGKITHLLEETVPDPLSKTPT